MSVHVYVSGESLSLKLEMSSTVIGIFLLMQERTPKPNEISGFRPINLMRFDQP